MNRMSVGAILAWLWRGLASVSSMVLLLFMLRRWFFLLNALRPCRRRRPLELATPWPTQWPTLLLLVPFRNERVTLPELLSCLEGVTYPAEAVTTVLIDDGSTDGGQRIARLWAGRQPGRHLIQRPASGGKAAALDEALSRFAEGELVAVYDADDRPEATALSKLAARFQQPRMGAATGRRIVSNPLDSIYTSHAALESLVHQQITARAKEHVGLAPPTLGSNCLYRRAALEQVGGFQAGTLLEDSDLSVKLVRAGWLTCFEHEAVSYHIAPVTLAGYWRQHTRWMGGFRAVARDQLWLTLSAGQLPWLLRLELLAFSFGYLDRAAWLLNCLWIASVRLRAGHLPRRGTRLLLASWMTPLLQIMVAMGQTRAPATLWRRIAWLPWMLPLDMLMSLWGVLRGGRVWEARESHGPDGSSGRRSG